MATIDDKVVAMSFEASKFESGVNQAINALEKLKTSLKLPAASKGLDDVGAAAKRLDLSHIGRSVDSIVQKLNYFSVAAIAIFTNVAMKAVQAGAQMVKGLTIDPIIAGYKEYATNLQSIQTILANTQAAGTNLTDVTKALDELNEYSDKTIYNFSQMARNIGTFTAAGVALEPATAAIKGIANLAALSGSSAEQASTAMYQLSQALAAGRVSLMDWNSVVNAGMGGTVFQRALAQTAEVMGTLEKGAVKLTGPMKNVTIHGEAFRNSLAAKPGEKVWLTSEVLTNTLKQFTSDLSDAELAAMGFSREQIKAIQLQAKTAMFAATEVKTLTQVWDVAKETAGSGWAQTWRLIFGDFEEAKTTFTALSNAVNGFINANADARNKVLADWKEMGGRTLLIDAIKTAFQNLGKILKPIKEAFRDIFPAKTGQDLFNFTNKFSDLAYALAPSVKTVENLKRTFAGVFAALDIGKQIVSGIFTVFKELFGALGGGNGGFLELTGSIGDWVVALDKALKKGDRLHNFFVSLGQVLAKPVEMLSNFAGAIGEAIKAISSGGMAAELTGITVAATPLQVVLEALGKAWDSFSDSIKNSVDMSSVLESIGTAISGIGVALGHALSTMNFEVILDVIKTGLFAGLVVMFKQFLGKGSLLGQISKGFSSGILSNISGMFDSLNGSMKAMQQNIKAKTLKEIAIAIALLAASVLLLSLIDPEKLNSALGAMTIMFGELIGAMALLDKATKSAGMIKLPFMVASLIALAIAIDLLTIAVLALSRLSWDELLRGLAGIGGSLAIMVTAMKAMPMFKVQTAGILTLAITLNILALAVRQFASLDMVDLGKGLAGIAIGLKLMIAAMKAMPLFKVQTAGMLSIAIALNVLALAVKQFAGLSLAELGKGLGSIAIGLGVMVEAMRKMPPTMAVSAAQLLAMAGAIWILSSAVSKMGGMSISQIAKGLGALAGSIVILSVALKYMSANVRGAAALTLTAAAIGILAPALVLLGKQSLGSIVKSMIALAGALAIMGAAGFALAPVAPALLALGLAMALIGGGLALAGAGLLAIAAGISALVVAGPAGIGIMVAALREFYKTIPELAKNLVLGLLAVVQGIADSAPQFVAAIVELISILSQAIVKSSPKIVVAFIALIDAALKVLSERQDEIIAAGFALLLALLQGLLDNIGQVTTMVIKIIVTFLQTIANNMTKIVTAGANILIQLLKGIADNLARIVLAVGEIVIKFINALATNYYKIIAAGANMIIKLLEGVTKNLGKIVSAGADAIINFVTGIGANIGKVITAGVNVVIKFIEGLGQNAVRLANAAAKVIVEFLDGLTLAINTYAPQIQAASMRLGWAIINGLTWGLAGKAQELYDKAKEIADKVLDILKKPWKIFNPSKTTMDIGTAIVEGLTRGMDSNAQDAYNSAIAMSNGVIGAFNSTFQTASPSKVLMEIGRWVGQGFAQGLRGSQDDIQSAFAELNQKLTDAITTARQTIASEKTKLEGLLKESKPDRAAIDESNRIIKENEIILKRSIDARRAVRGAMKEERAELRQLSVEYETNNRKIDEARQLLQNLIQEKKAFIESTTQQYATLPEIQTVDAEGNPISPEQQVANYLEALRIQAEAVAAYKATLDQLRELGLDDATYQKLLEEGTADQSFANQLLAGGKTAVEALNTLDKQLYNVSKTLATNAAKNLKNGGIEAAKGLLAGLTSQNEKIRDAMERISDDIVAIVKRKLHIKSPSEVFAEIGVWAMQGLANGFTKSTSFVADALVAATDNAIDAAKSTLSRISDIIAQDLDQNPVITPVLDLSQVRSQAGALEALTNVTPITAAASYGQAAIISAAQIAAQMEELVPTSSTPTVKFEQNNYSPIALTEIEIFRQTKNQLSQVKALIEGTLPTYVPIDGTRPTYAPKGAI